MLRRTFSHSYWSNVTSQRRVSSRSTTNSLWLPWHLQRRSARGSKVAIAPRGAAGFAAFRGCVKLARAKKAKDGDDDDDDDDYAAADDDDDYDDDDWADVNADDGDAGGDDAADYAGGDDGDAGGEGWSWW